MKRGILRASSWLIILLISVFALTGFSGSDTINSPTTAPGSGKLITHYIDVGQNDSQLIELPNKETVLIDAGNEGLPSTVVPYLKAHNIKTINYLILTHPHNDHISEAPEVINAFTIGKIYMPKATTNTKVFEELLLAIKNKGLKVNSAIGGTKIIDTPDLQLAILAPNSNTYEDLNNYSIVTKLTYKKVSFLSMGDAEELSESEMLKKGYPLAADVLKIGHHGSNSSSSLSFLKTVQPKYSIISVSKSNTFGHPHQDTLSRLKTIKSQVFMTSANGSIIATSDGNTISFDKSPSLLTNTNTSVTNQNQLYITKTGTKYHLGSCSYLSADRIPILLPEAKSKGYTPCSRCNPPQ